jgi:prepilin peptidase CpaA
MDSWSLYQSVAFATFAVPLVVAAGFDVARYVVPNAIVLTMVALFVVIFVLAPHPVDWVSHIAAGALLFGAGTLTFRIGVMGGGDVKLWAASALWVGLDGLPAQLLAVTVIGAGLAVALLAIRTVAGRAVHQPARAAALTLPRILRGGEPVPYGVAIAAGAILDAVHRAPPLG